MVWPPILPGDGRTNTTLQLDNHPSDHNKAKVALETIVDKIGSTWTGVGSYSNVNSRFEAYGRSCSFLIAHENSEQKWQEAADYIFSKSDANANTNQFIALMFNIASNNIGQDGGGNVVFAPVAGDYYRFSSTAVLPIPSNVNIAFAGGLGKGSAFFGSGSIDPVDVQAHFAGGIILSSSTSIYFGAGTYLFGDTQGTSAGIAAAEGAKGIHISGAGVEITTIMRHRALNQPLFAALGALSNFVSYVTMNDFTASGGDAAYDIFYLLFTKHLYLNNIRFNATNAAAIYADIIWDSAIENIRFDFVGTRGKIFNSNPDVGSATLIRGALTILSGRDNETSNNFNINNATFETIGDCAIFVGGTGLKNTNKCYWSNIKIEDSIRENHPLVYLKSVSQLNINNLDCTDWINRPNLNISGNPVIALEAAIGVTIDGLAFNLVDTTVERNIASNSSQNILSIDNSLGGQSNQYNNWRAYITDASGLFKTDVKINSYSGTSLTVDSEVSAANGDKIKIYSPSISSFIQIGDDVSGLKCSNIRIELGKYRWPMVGSIPGGLSIKGSFFYFAGLRISNIEIDEPLYVYAPTPFSANNDNNLRYYAISGVEAGDKNVITASGTVTRQIDPRTGSSFYIKMSGQDANITLNFAELSTKATKEKAIYLYLYNVDNTRKTIIFTANDSSFYVAGGSNTYTLNGGGTNSLDVIKAIFRPRITSLSQPFWIIEVIGQNIVDTTPP